MERDQPATQGEPLSSPDTPSSLALSPSGKVIAAGYEDGMVRFWNASTRQQIGATVTVAADSDQIDVMAFSPAARRLPSAATTAQSGW